MLCEHEQLLKDPNEKTVWYCPVCECNFVITNIADTKLGKFKSWFDSYVSGRSLGVPERQVSYDETT